MARSCLTIVSLCDLRRCSRFGASGAKYLQGSEQKSETEIYRIGRGRWCALASRGSVTVVRNGHMWVLPQLLSPLRTATISDGNHLGVMTP